MSRFATLHFDHAVAAPLATLWQVWTAPAARAIWAAPSPDVTVEFLDSNPVVGGREVSLCKVAGQPDIHCEVGWLALQPPHLSVNYEVITATGQMQSAALVSADFHPTESGSRIAVTVQLSGLSGDMTTGYRQGFTAGLANLAGVAGRTMILQREISAPRAAVWSVWMNPETLPQWWGPDGFSCRTSRIDLRSGGDWVFDMIGPDGTVFPNHHRYHDLQPQSRFAYSLHWGENGPKHADAWASFEETATGTLVTLGMVFSTEAEFHAARGFGAEALGQQTLGKLAAQLGVA